MTEPLRVQVGKGVATPPTGRPAAAKAANELSFGKALTQAQGIQFTKHAQKRLEVRDIQLTEDNLARLATAVEKVEKRGGRESLVLMDDMAFIVNVADRKVVTAMDAKSRGEGVFTQIDSVVLADDNQAGFEVSA